MAKIYASDISKDALEQLNFNCEWRDGCLHHIMWFEPVITLNVHLIALERYIFFIA